MKRALRAIDRAGVLLTVGSIRLVAGREAALRAYEALTKSDTRGR